MRPRIGDNVDSSQSFEHSFGASSRNVLRSQTHLCCFKRLACSEVFCDNRHSSGFAMSSMRADRPSSQGERDRCSGNRAAATIRLDQFDRCDRRGKRWSCCLRRQSRTHWSFRDRAESPFGIACSFCGAKQRLSLPLRRSFLQPRSRVCGHRTWSSRDGPSTRLDHHRTDRRGSILYFVLDSQEEMAKHWRAQISARVAVATQCMERGLC
jgi:hypothetical protein